MDLQVVVMSQDMQQRASKGRKEEDCLLLHEDENNAGVKLFRKVYFAILLMWEAMHSSHLWDLKGTHTEWIFTPLKSKNNQQIH